MACSSRSSGSSGMKKGEEWKSMLYFDTDAGVGGRPDYLDDDELVSGFMRLAGKNETISKVEKYKVRLFGWQRTSLIMHHQFIVFKTDGWYWSIEKDSEFIIVQRARSKSNLTEKCRRGDRNLPVTLLEEKNGKGKSLKDLVIWLHQNEELGDRYMYLETAKNCQGFAGRVYDFL